MKQVQQGFTLIELMIVVAIIGILAAVAVPQYQQYTVRSQVTEGLAMAAEFKTAVSEFYSARGTAPADNTAVGLEVATNYTGNYVTQILVDGGDIQVTFGNRANADLAASVLSLGMWENSAGGVVWVCGEAAAPTGAEAVAGANSADTTVEAQYLPTDCRA